MKIPVSTPRATSEIVDDLASAIAIVGKKAVGVELFRDTLSKVESKADRKEILQMLRDRGIISELVHKIFSAAL
jgi:ribosomal protein S7